MSSKLVLFCIAALLIMPSACLGRSNNPELISNDVNASNMVRDTADSSQEKTSTNRQEKTDINSMNIKIGETVLTATLADNSSVDALKDALSDAPITVRMRDYGNMEKVGALGRDLPRNDEPITTEAGDIILYQGSALVIYYAPNTWSFTRLGKIDNITQTELKELLGSGDVTVTLSLPQE